MESSYGRNGETGEYVAFNAQNQWKSYKFLVHLEEN